MAISKISSAGTTGFGRRNLLINGAMNVAQRGTSFTTSGYTLDRLYYTTSGATATVTQEDMSASDRSTYGFEHYAKLVTTTGNNNSGFYFKIEGKDLYHLIDNKFTFSFLAKGTNPAGGSLEFQPRWYDGTNVDAGTAQNITLNSTWTKHTVTFEFPTITNASTTAANFQGQIKFTQGNANTSTNAWELNITGVQLEVGSTATEFEHRSYGEELALCQRYFQYYENPPLRGVVNTSTKANRCGMVLSVIMRANPSLTLQQIGSSTHFRIYDGSASATYSSFQNSWLKRAKIEFDINVTGSSLTLGRAACLFESDVHESAFLIDAEL